MSKRILLINPPFYRLLGSHYNANSLGIAYIASYLNQNGHDAWIYNADYVNQREYAELREIFDSFVNYTDYFKNEQLNIGLLNSGTSALHLALETLNLTDQDEKI